ncbi:hypothetical protein GUJ93_ZPchr0001g31671 [Zizania palustris]|uniref:VTT domain-containing protein n=1 Tax=Zizania palustris TaxID=103762 RepID=A0A8J5S3Z3_ZIZPA|nr:hypothetical protein GUJ93_ZPchr0001g31671 [Zizania palustris]
MLLCTSYVKNPRGRSYVLPYCMKQPGPLRSLRVHHCPTRCHVPPPSPLQYFPPFPYLPPGGWLPLPALSSPTSNGRKPSSLKQPRRHHALTARAVPPPMRQPHLLSPQQLAPSPVLSSHFSPPAPGGSPWRRCHRRTFHPPLSSLRDPDKATLRKASPNVPFRLGGGGSGSPKDQRPSADDEEEEEEEEEGEEEVSGAGAITGTLLAGALLVGVVGGFGAAGYVYKDQINTFLTQFSGFIDGYGPAGYALFVLVYAGLEVLAIPAIPLTMSAGLLFGSVTGTIIVSISGTLAAAVAFLIARYFARERILKLVEGNKKFLAIDKAIGENGFKVVTLLRLSPLLPFSLGNYLYGLTSVKFLPYVLGSWLGMLPGSWAYVSAGAFGRAIIQDESEIGLGGNSQLLTLGIGLLFTAIAATYVTRLAKDAVKEIDD